MRLAEYLNEQDVPYQALLHPPAYTAGRLAKYLRIAACHVLHGVLLDGPEGRFVAVLPANRQLDLERLRAFWGGPIREVTIAESARLFHDCEWGVVSPFGCRYGLMTLLEASVPADTWVVLEAGSHFESVLLMCEDYERISGAIRLEFARPL